VREVIPGTKIVKALGRAHYLDGDTARVVFTQSIDDAVLGQVDGGVPLFFQERIEAADHLRVVTVLDRVWTCALAAEGLPVDWRTNAEAHNRFEAITTAPAIRDGALEVARKLGLGYSSQDWIQTADDVVLLDVNPGGQWLFLPEPVTTEVVTEITRWLENQ
jgi:glutathione synthase/RimK-type ligase-like ATP-grasp enzyme